jgi:hypothetical protein
MPVKKRKTKKQKGGSRKGVRYQLFGGAWDDAPPGSPPPPPPRDRAPPPYRPNPPPWSHPGPTIVADMPRQKDPWHKRIISRGLRAIGATKWADKAEQMGLGYHSRGTHVRKMTTAKQINY